MGRLSETSLLRLEFIWGVVDIALSAIGLYFIYRYAITVMVLDQEDRDILLGPVISKWVPSDDTVITVLGSAYIAFKVVTLFITSTNWETNLQKRTRELRKKQGYNREEVEQANILEPRKLTAADFTNRES